MADLTRTLQDATLELMVANEYHQLATETQKQQLLAQTDTNRILSAIAGIISEVKSLGGGSVSPVVSPSLPSSFVTAGSSIDGSPGGPMANGARNVPAAPPVSRGSLSLIGKLGESLKGLSDPKVAEGSENLRKAGEGLKAFGDVSMAHVFFSLKLMKMFPGLLRGISEELGQSNDLKKVSENFGDPLKSIGEGLRSFAEIPWPGVLLSVKAFKFFAGSLGSLGAEAEKIDKPLESLERVSGKLEKLTSALSNLSEKLGESIGSFFRGIGKDTKSILKGSVALAAIAGSLAVASVAFVQFTKVDFASFAMGVTTLAALTGAALLLGSSSPGILLGAAALGILSASLLVASAGLASFSDVSWRDVLVGVTALGVLTAGVVALGTFMASGVGAAAIFLGIAAIAALGVALIPAAYAMTLFGSGLALVSDSMEKIVPQFVQLGEIAPMLYVAAGGITAVAAALTLFGASQALTGISSFFGSLVGAQTSPIDKLKELAGLGPGLNQTADALDRIAAFEGTRKASELNATISESDTLTEDLQTAAARTQREGASGKTSAVVSNSVSSKTSNMTVFNNNWMPDRSSLFVLATA